MSVSKFVEINGSKIHYIEEGSGENTILFLHGILVSSYLWRNIIPVLSKHARCIAPDLIGMGKSDKPTTSVTFSHQQQHINAFIEALQLKNITLVLHGFGSIIGCGYAMSHPNNVKGIAFYESHLRPTNNFSNLSLPIQELVYLFSQEPDCGYKKIVKDNFLIDKLLSGLAINLNSEAKSYYQQQHKNVSDRELLWGHFKELYLSKDYDRQELNAHITKYSDFLQKSSVPKLLLYNNPGFNTSMANVQWCKDHLPNIKLADLDEGMHLAPETDPLLFGNILLDWYKTIIKSR
jgi:haloalkane dehalogenase